MFSGSYDGRQIAPGRPIAQEPWGSGIGRRIAADEVGAMSASCIRNHITLRHWRAERGSTKQ